MLSRDPSWTRTKYPGVYVRHRKACPVTPRCRCEPSWRVRYRDADGPRWSRTFTDLPTARNWQATRDDNATADRRDPKAGPTFRELADRFLDDAESGAVAQRSGDPYAPRTLQIYRRDLCNHTADIGRSRAASLDARDWQAWIDAMHRDGASRNTIQTRLNAVLAVYRWACSPRRGLLPVNVVRGLEMPARDEVKRDRIASPTEAAALLGALADPVDTLEFALALYVGLRNVERWGLEWGRHVELDTGRIRITRDITKSDAGKRTLPVIARLSPLLKREHLRQGKPTDGLVVRTERGKRPDYHKQAQRCARAWERAGLQRITPHEGRHTFASYLIASGLNAKAVTVLMGHSSVQITFDRYGHLFPGHEDEAGTLLDRYMEVGT